MEPINPESILKTIIKVVCGYSHVLALSDEGEVYTWGSNNYGQLGNRTKTNKLMPSIIESESNLGRWLCDKIYSMVSWLIYDYRVMGVAANHSSHISVATSFSGKVYMWGMCRGQNVSTPTETRFSSLDDVFSCFASPACSWRTICVTSKWVWHYCMAGKFWKVKCLLYFSDWCLRERIAPCHS